MTIDTQLSLLPLDKINLQQDMFDVQPLGSSTGSSGLFAALLAQQVEETPSGNAPVDDSLSDDVNTLKKEGFTGFFKKIQEEKMKELREKILEEMGLTEETLAKMPPEQRATIEKMIAKEIAMRMSAESALEDDKETDSIQKRLLLAELDNPMEF